MYDITGDFGDHVPGLGEQEECYRLRLYVAGQTAKSITAVRNLRRICEEHLAGKFQIEVIDLMENPQLAKNDQVVAIPTLVRKLPPPLKRIIGDLSNFEKVVVGLEIQQPGGESGAV